MRSLPNVDSSLKDAERKTDGETDKTQHAVVKKGRKSYLFYYVNPLNGASIDVSNAEKIHQEENMTINKCRNKSCTAIFKRTWAVK